MLVDTLRDPLVSAVIMLLITMVVLIARRTHAVALEATRKRKEALLILGCGLTLYGVLCVGGIVTPGRTVFFSSGPSTSGQGTTTPVPVTSGTAAPMLRSKPTGVPMLTPPPTPPPTPLPALSRSITQELTTFCDAIAHSDCQTAWGQYAVSLQHTHAFADVVDIWRHFTACTLPDQVGDPSAFTIFDVQMANGYVDQYGFIKQASYRVTVQVEGKAWRISQVCHIISEGCFPVTWG